MDSYTVIETFLVLASVYWEPQLLPNGEKFKPYGLTVAHKTLPIGTCIKVKLGLKWTTALINDRGPYKPKRELDLSLGTAKKLGMGKNSLNKIRYWIVDKEECR